VFNVLLLMVVGHGYLAGVPAGTSLTGWAVTLLAFTANFAMLALAPLLVALLALVSKRSWITLTVAVIFYALLAIFIYADSMIYQLWRFHFNSMVLNLLTTPGASDSVTAGHSTVVSTLLVVGVLLLAELGFAFYLFPALSRRGFAAKLRNKKALAISCGAVVLLIVLDKAVFDVGDFRGDVEILRLRNLLPLYQTLTVKRFANKVLGVNVSPSKRLKFKAGSGSFDYPKAPIHFRPDGPRPNIVIISIEGARFDMLTPDVMPDLYRWSESNLVFEANYSGGNTTRYGIFGLFYGIYGSYWQHALAEHDGPVLIKSLKQLGYNFRILCCTDLNYPEFRRTCFVDVPDAITDKWPGGRIERDRLMPDEFVKFLDENRQPFFAFMFFDASHQPYRYPPEHEVFDVGGVTDDLNYLKLPHDAAGMAFIKNRYKNSLHYVDEELGRSLRAMQERGLMTNTLVFVMGDHGEEFRECGLFGHDSSFSPWQTKTLMVAHIPGETPRKISRLTSHLDVPPTILTYMGAENPLSDYTQGISLTATQEQPFVYVASWDTAAIIDHRTTTTFGLAAYKAETAVFDQNYALLPRQREALAAKTDQLLDALNGMRTFTK
jgi:uncharacterized protein